MIQVITTSLLVLILLTGGLFSALPIYASVEEGGDTGDSDGETESEEPEPEPEVTPTKPEPEPEPEIPVDAEPPTVDPITPLPEPVLPPEGDLPICDGSPRDCITLDGNICLEGQGGHECECQEDISDCPNHPSLPILPSPSPKKPLPYCDLMPDDFQGSCHDRRDWDDITKLYPCNDGTQKKDYHDCVDASNPDWPKHCTKNFDKCKERSDKIIKIIKNVNIVKKINSVENNGDLNIEQSIVAINYDEGAGINCFFGDDNDGQCETFDVNKDSGKEPLLQIISFT